MEQSHWFKTGKGKQVVYCQSTHLTSVQSASCEMLYWMNDKLESINSLRYADYTTLRAESEEELKSLLMRVKEESEKAGLKLNIEKPKTMASTPITSMQIEGEKVAAVTDFIFLGSKITVDSVWLQL